MAKKMSLWGVGPKILTPGYCLMFGINMAPWKLHLTDLTPISHSIWGALGGAWLVIGIYLLVDAGRRVTKAYYAGKLATEGIYSYTRNPLYCVHLLFVMFGLWLMLNNVYPIVGIVYSLIAFYVLIPREERYLQEKFGEVYEKYCHTTNRLFPWPPKKGRVNDE